MPTIRSINRAGATALLAVAATAVLGLPALAQDASSAPPTAFGQEMPRQYLFNRMMSPHNSAEGAGSGGGQAAGQGGGAGQAASQGAGGAQAANGGQAANNEDDDGPGPYPKRYLLNKMFNLGGGQ